MPHSRKHRWIHRVSSVRCRPLRKRRRDVARFCVESLEERILLTTVASVDPPANSHDAAVSTDVVATFDQVVAAATAQTFVVHGTQSRGQLSESTTSVSASGPVATHDPMNDFFPGETVQVTVTSGVTTAGGAATPRVWQFRTENTSGSGQFVDSGQVLGANESNEVRFGDLDGDGDLDTVHGGRVVWLNDGSGVFTDTGQSLSGGEVELADLDGDGDLDVVGFTAVWLNDGSSTFTNTGQNLLGGLSIDAGDIDGDGDIDVMQGVAYAGNRVWLNDGSGMFTNSGQSLGNSATEGLQFGDLDGDGDLDAFAANNGPDNRVWMNDGNGTFTDSMQALGGFRPSLGVELGDLDGDGDLDALVSNNDQQLASRVWLNDGGGVFTESGQVINSNSNNWTSQLGDLDGDGDLDVFIGGGSSPSVVWMNDGDGNFSDTGQRLTFPGLRRARGIDLGDVDGDGDLDAWESNTFTGGGRLWINQNLTPSVEISIDSPTIVEAEGLATITATLSAIHTDPVTVDLEISGTATVLDDYTITGTQIVIPAGASDGSVVVTAVQDTVDEPDETIVVGISSVTNGQAAGAEQVTTTILDDDEPPIPNVTLSVDLPEIPEDAGAAIFTATLSESTTVDVTVELGFSGTASAADYTASATQILLAAGETSGTITVTAVQDTDDEQNETVVVDIVSVTGGNEDGTQQAVTTITDDDGPASFAVSTFAGTSTGFTAQFNAVIDTADLNLYNTSAGLGAADIILAGATVGNVVGSVVVDPSLQMITFIASGGVLAPDTYTATLRSAADGFEDSDGRLLDGNADGTAGDDYSSNFTVVAPATGAVTLSLPNVVRGPGQDVKVPAVAEGLPLTIDEGTAVRNVTVSISYDEDLLSVTGATLGADMPAGATAALDTSTAGTAVLAFTSPVDLPPGSNILVNLTSTVPTENASAIYRRMQVLDIHSASVTDANSNSIPVLDDDAIQVTEFFGDLSGNGRVNATDASQAAQFAALLIDGFAASPLADPIVVGDVSGNVRINAADASQIAQFAALLPVPTIPPIPAGAVTGGVATVGRGRALPGVASLPPQIVDTSSSRRVGNSFVNSEGAADLAAGSDIHYRAVDRALSELSDSADLGGGEDLTLSLEAAIQELLTGALLVD